MLFAAQRFCHDAGHPPGLLTRIFRDLYNGDVLDEPAMQRWRDDTSDQTPGKTKATYDVTEYLVELEAEAEEVISTKKP
jgi:translation initiation factor 4G